MYRHHSHRFLTANYYCNWCGCSPLKADIPCDYRLIATDPNWKPRDCVLSEILAIEAKQKEGKPRTKEEITLQRKYLKDKLQRMIKRTVAKMKALEIDEVTDWNKT